MSTWTDRVALARDGWMTEIRLTRSGITPRTPTTVAAGIWAKTHYWAGWPADVCLHDHLILDIAEAGAHVRLEALMGNMREACARARRTFEDSVPCQLPDKDGAGRLMLGTNSIEARHNEGRARDIFPSENIPAGIEDDVMPPASDHLARLMAAAGAGLHVEDSINPHIGRARYMRDCKDRDWGYKLRLARRQAGGVVVAFRPQVFTVEMLHERMAAQLITAAHAANEEVFALHAPGGPCHGWTANSLPPGEQTLEEIKTRDRA